MEVSSDYRARRQAVDTFNASSPVLKRRLVADAAEVWYLLQRIYFNQAGALVHICTDGSILVNHGNGNGPGPEHQGRASRGA